MPNLCSFAGLSCSGVAIYASIHASYNIAMVGMIWAVAFDWADGLIARGMSGRNEMQGKFGAQLDVLIDIVSYGVTPAILLACYGGFEVEFLAVALFVLFASALRLSYFSVFGLSGGSHYTGLALDNNNIFVVFIFVFEGWVGESFAIILLLLSLLIALLNISQIKTPKLSSNPINVVLLGSYTVLITCFFYWKQFNQI
ncbi:CDP-alcohol phosphatidyltransferase family protein [Opitutales bacterium]|nr:CDP-alcohol phosphatidyltransferase family protein [Opitutales bacterium]MDC3336205.1 CDP-alcohol phosphatidyltransferase family protein [Opitutales bacterium]